MVPDGLSADTSIGCLLLEDVFMISFSLRVAILATFAHGARFSVLAFHSMGAVLSAIGLAPALLVFPWS
jgi:hypothetical protein